MPQALQVNFRHLLPSEELVTLARGALSELCLFLPCQAECLVSLARRSADPGTPTDAHVRVDCAGKHLEARAVDRDPARALRVALEQLMSSVAMAS